MPGALKNALDWASRPFAETVLRSKPVAVIGCKPRGCSGPVRAQADLRRILATIGARVEERDLPVAQAHEAFTADGDLRDPKLVRTRDRSSATVLRAAQRAA